MKRAATRFATSPLVRTPACRRIERFDVTPYADGLTRFLLRHRLSSTLPRKFKIAFEGCGEDHIATAINDLGFRAELAADGTRGFRVIAGGGTAIMCKSAGIIHDFLPASGILRVAEAMLRVFKQFGDYEHKQRNRMKFMIKTLGWDRWKAEYDRALAACEAEGVPLLEIDPPARRGSADVDSRRGAVAEPDRVARRRSPALGPGHHADAGPRLSAGGRGVCALARHQRAGRRSSSAT